MPLVGTREATAFNNGPLLTKLESERWELPGCGILQLMYEIDADAMTSLLPPALHPTIPPTVVLTVMNVPDSPAGAFMLAEAKIGCRSGARPRGLSMSAFCNSTQAITELASRWGFPLRQADVQLQKRYDRVVGEVTLDGRTVLEITMMNPEPIAGNDIQYLAGLNVARIDREGSVVPRLVQVDPDYVFRSADRGKPELGAFDAAAFGIPAAKPVWAVSASYAVADITMPDLRYLVDPSKPPLAAVEKL